MTVTEYLAQKFYTPEEAAPVMHLKLRTVRAMIRTGKIKTARGKTKLIPECAIAEYLGMELAANGRQ